MEYIAADRRIAEEDLARNIQAGYRQIYQAADKYRQGFMAADEFDRLSSEAVHRHFYQFLSEKGLHIRLKCAGWDGFLEDHRLWLRGELPVRAADPAERKPWLIVGQSAGDGRSAWAEAAPEDRKAFFDLMSAFDLPADYFAPVPGDITDERDLGIPSGSCYSPMFWTIVSDWQDAEGLTQDAAPEGKTFTLISGLGLKARVTVGRRTVSGNGFCYHAAGTIEGYTADRPREILVYAARGIITALSYGEEKDDREVYAAYPLWQDFLADRDLKNKLWQSSLSRLEKRFAMLADIR